MDARAGRLRGLFLSYRILPPESSSSASVLSFPCPDRTSAFRREWGRERPVPILAQEVVGCLPKLSLMRIRARGSRRAIEAEEQVRWQRRGRLRPRRPQEDSHDASLRATSPFTTFVRVPLRIGPAAGGCSPRAARPTAVAAR